jgi:hypothetical protein
VQTRVVWDRDIKRPCSSYCSGYSPKFRLTTAMAGHRGRRPAATSSVQQHDRLHDPS